MPDYGSTDGRADPAAKDPVIVVVMLTLCSYVNPLYSMHKLQTRDHILRDAEVNNPLVCQFGLNEFLIFCSMRYPY